MKKIVSLIMALVLVLAMVPAAFAAETSFTDVAEGKYYFDAVNWAVAQGVTNGTGDGTTFSPANGCSRKEVVTFLWRAAGKPNATVENPFTDIPEGKYYTEAVLWAYENGITTGKTATTFKPDDTCTRAQIVTFLYRYNNSPAIETTENPFPDVTKGTFFNAILWAYENGITKGNAEGNFQPNKTCTRGDIVTFLYRNLAQQEETPTEPETPPTEPSSPSQPSDPTPDNPTDPSAPSEPTEDTPAQPDWPNEVKYEETVVCDTDDFTVTVLGYRKNGIYGPTFTLTVENHTNQPVAIMGDRFLVNGGVTVYGLLYEEIRANSFVNTTVSFNTMELERAGITDIVSLCALDTAFVDLVDFNTVSDLIPIQVTASGFHGYKQAEKTGTDLLLDKNGVKIFSQGVVTDEYGWAYAMLAIKNETDDIIWVEADKVQVNGIAVEGLLYEAIAPGSVSYTYVEILPEQLEYKGITEIKSISFEAVAYDNTEYDQLFAAELVAVQAN